MSDLIDTSTTEGQRTWAMLCQKAFENLSADTTVTFFDIDAILTWVLPEYEAITADRRSAALSDVERRIEVAERERDEARALGLKLVSERDDEIDDLWRRMGRTEFELDACRKDLAALRSSVERMTQELAEERALTQRLIPVAQAGVDYVHGSQDPGSPAAVVAFINLRDAVAAVDTYEANTGGTE